MSSSKSAIEKYTTNTLLNKKFGCWRNTRAAHEWQYGLLEVNTKYSKPTVCPDFISGAKVQTDQNNASLSKPPEGNPDMVEINNVKVDCNMYGKFNIPRNF